MSCDQRRHVTDWYVLIGWCATPSWWLVQLCILIGDVWTSCDTLNLHSIAEICRVLHSDWLMDDFHLSCDCVPLTDWSIVPHMTGDNHHQYSDTQRMPPGGVPVHAVSAVPDRINNEDNFNSPYSSRNQGSSVVYSSQGKGRRCKFNLMNFSRNFW